MVAPILSACAIRASLTYIAILYAALSGITAPLSETQLIVACASGDTMECALAALNKTGAVTRYHYDRGLISRVLVGVRDVERVCVRDMDHDSDYGALASCVRGDIIERGPIIASRICGRILAIDVMQENFSVVEVRAEPIDGGEPVVFIAPRADDDFEAALGEFWRAEAYDAIAEGAGASASDQMIKRLLIIATSLIGAVLSVIGTKWGAKYVAKCREHAAAAPEMYLG